MKGEKCIATATIQSGKAIGHNGGPELEPFGLRARWLRFAKDRELRQLAKIHMRIERRKRAISELVADRQTIMNRCIKRMRRANGKN